MGLTPKTRRSGCLFHRAPMWVSHQRANRLRSENGSLRVFDGALDAHLDDPICALLKLTPNVQIPHTSPKSSSHKSQTKT